MWNHLTALYDLSIIALTAHQTSFHVRAQDFHALSASYLRSRVLGVLDAANQPPWTSRLSIHLKDVSRVPGGGCAERCLRKAAEETH